MGQSAGTIRVVLHGYFKKLCPHDCAFKVSTPAEALLALFSQVKAFQPKPGKPRYSAQVVGFEDGADLFKPTDLKEIHLVPAFIGGKNGGFMQIALGAVLIAASFMIPVAGIPLASIGLTGSITAGSVFFAGVMMVAGGLLAVMSPTPRNDFNFNNGPQTGDPPPSKYLGAPGNTTAIGTRIPLLVGRHVASGHYLSFTIQATDVVL